MSKLDKTRSKMTNVGKFYGAVLAGAEGFERKGFITCTEYNPAGYATGYTKPNVKYTVRSVNGLTAGNGWDAYDSYSLQETVDKIFSRSPLNEVHVFDNGTELLTWLLAS